MNTTTQSIYMEKQVTKTTCFSGSKAVIETLLREGVDTVFGYPGGTIMPVYDALYDYRDRLNHILVRHEQGALHAAQGYARVSGRPGVCIVTSGPGATNTVTGLADAMMDSTCRSDQRTGRFRFPGHRCFSGNQLRRDHPGCNQMELPGTACRRYPCSHRQGILYRPHGTSRTRRGRYYQRCPARNGRISL